MTTSTAASLCRLLALALACALCQPALAQSAPANRAASERSAQLAAKAFTRGDATPAWVDQISQIPEASKTVPIALRLADVQMHLAAQPVVYIRRALLANDASSLGALGQYEIDFQPEYQQVQLHSLRILRGGATLDRLQSAQIRFLQRETGLDQGVYSGSITAAIVTDDVRAGDTLEVAYSLIGQNPVFADKFFDSAAWDSPVPVSLRRVTLDTPENRPVHYRVIGDQGGAVKAYEWLRNGRNIVRFEARDMPALLGEPYVPNDVPAYRWIQFSEFRAWSELNTWALGLFDASTTPAQLAEALRGARAAATPQQAVAKVLEFVQNDIRYLSVSLGENSHRPFPPAEVLQRRYGDCKDKSQLMVAMLRAIGVEAEPVLVSTHYRKGLDQMLPSPILFDHAIVRAKVQGKVYFFDPTRQGQYGALERMGQVHAGAQVMVVGPGRSALETIALVDDLQLITDERSEAVNVSDMAQPVELVARSRYAGAEAEAARVQLGATDLPQLQKAMASAIGRRYPESEVLGAPQVSDDRQNNLLTIETRYRIKNFFEASSAGWTFRYRPSNMAGVFYVPDIAKRDYPLSVPNAPAVHRYSFELTLPDSFNEGYRPSKTKLTDSSFSMTEELALSGRTAKAQLELALTADRVAPADVIAFVADTRKASEMMDGRMLVRRAALKRDAAAAAEAAKAATQTIQTTQTTQPTQGTQGTQATPAASPTPAAPPVPYAQALRTRLEATLAASTRAVADAELAGQEAGGALCQRALLQSYLGKSADGLKDAAKAVRLQPQSPVLLRCRADVNFSAGNFQDSANDYGRALALGASDDDLFFSKALADLYQGARAPAAAGFSRALKQAGEPVDQLRASIWLTILGQPQDRPAGGPAAGDPWLAAALDMFGKKDGPAHMLSLANQNGGAGLDPRLAEAYFYAGKYYLLAQDKLRAKVYFQRVIDKGVTNQLYYTLARHELARL